MTMGETQKTTTARDATMDTKLSMGAESKQNGKVEDTKDEKEIFGNEKTKQFKQSDIRTTLAKSVEGVDKAANNIKRDDVSINCGDKRSPTGKQPQRSRITAILKTTVLWTTNG